MNPAIQNRKGARKLQDIPPEVLALLNQGRIETVNLTEWLAVDHAELVEWVFPSLGIEQQTVEVISEAIASQKKSTSMNSTKLVGSMVYQTYEDSPKLEQIVEKLAQHLSDSVRGYAPFLIGLNHHLSLEEKLNRTQKLVADKHFGVREVVWLALRPEIDKHLLDAIELLSKWADHEDENIRRFTTEATRPRGVWCKHIDALKDKPELALPILEKLKSDPSKYVQDSVGNWLNDASKTRPEFVIELCDDWQNASPSKETAKIIKRARRTIDKK